MVRSRGFHHLRVAFATASILAAVFPRSLGEASPVVSLVRSAAIPVAGRTIRCGAEVHGAPPGSAWRLNVVITAPDGVRREIARAELRASDAGTADLQTRVRLPAPGWFRLEARAASAETVLTRVVDLPVTARRVDFAWYQAESARELRWVTMQLTAGAETRSYWERRGVVPARWCGAACGKNKPLEFFIRKWSSHDAIAIDEFGGGKAACEKFTRALIETRRRRPDEFIAVWFAGGREFWPQLKDTIDVFMPEIYFNFGPWDLTRFDRVVRRAREAGVMPKLLVGLGIGVARDKQGNVRCRPTPEDVLAQVRYLKTIAPDLRGLAFFTYKHATPEVRRAADDACRQYFIDPVADLVQARAFPEAAPPGTPVQTRLRVRNAGGMPVHGLVLSLLLRDRVLTTAAVHLDAGEERTVVMNAGVLPGAGVLTAKIEPMQGVTILRRTARAPYARLPGAGAVFFTPGANVALPADSPLEIAPWDERSEPVVVRADGERNACALALFLQGLVGGPSRLTWLSPALRPDEPAFWRAADSPARGADRPPVDFRNVGGNIEIRAAGYRAVLSPREDALLSVTPGGDGPPLLASPWRVSWKLWRGFGPPVVRRTPVGVVVETPVKNDGLNGRSRYVFFPACISIERAFQTDDTVQVEYAAEGCRIAQHPGSFALRFGVGARVRRGRLAVDTTYRDLYFGSPSLDPDYAEAGGWFDFAWDQVPHAGLGVALVRQWTRRASKVQYDVTRYYDAADRFEIVQVWHAPVQVQSEASRILLVPHAGIGLDGHTLPPAAVLWERIRAPSRTMSTATVPASSLQSRPR